MIVLELIPEKLAQLITEAISIPTIGIGAGRFCDGQVQVILDIIGITKKPFRHVKKYADAARMYTDTADSYVNDVRQGYFPEEKNTAAISDDTLTHVTEWLVDIKQGR
jgi:3-methyl-2-oxobutanoate hydroxymethyltransferase